MRGRVIMGALVTAAVLGGCSAPSSGHSDRPTRAQSLWSARTDFVGDNSRVVTLTDEAGFGPKGTYSVSLQTERAPYGLTVAFDSLDKPFEDVDFSSGATLLLGLVGNLGTVSVTSDSRTYSLTESDASAALGFDVKELGRDEAKLGEYVALVDD